MNSRSGRFLFPLSALLLTATLGGCGGGSGGDDGSNAQNSLDPFTPAPPPTLGMTFDGQSFAAVAGSGDVASVLGNATVVSSSAPDEPTITATAAAINVALGSTRIFGAIRDGDPLTTSSIGPVRSSSIQIDVERFELDWDPDDDGGIFDQPGTWNVRVDYPGGAELNLFVQFEDRGAEGSPGKISKSYGDTRTNIIRVGTHHTELGFFGVNFLSFDDVVWEISGFYEEGDYITINGAGKSELKLKLPAIQDATYEFTITNLRLDTKNADTFRRPDSGEIYLKANNVIPILGEDFDMTLTFLGGNTASVRADAPLCDPEFEWNLSSGLPEKVELRDCL